MATPVESRALRPRNQLPPIDRLRDLTREDSAANISPNKIESRDEFEEPSMDDHQYGASSELEELSEPPVCKDFHLPFRVSTKKMLVTGQSVRPNHTRNKAGLFIDRLFSQMDRCIEGREA
jgi:hypothetical protein